MPYHVYYAVLNAKHYNIPQNRERVIIVGIRDDKDNVFTFPKKQPLKRRFRDVLESNVDAKYFLTKNTMSLQEKTHQKHKSKGNGFKFKPTAGNGIANAITTKAGQRITDNYVIDEIVIDSFTENKYESASRIYSIDGIAPAVKTRSGGSTDIKIRVKGYRRITPRECWRLQDFPDDFIWNVTDTQAYKQAGNSIPVGMLAAVISKLKL